MKHRVRVMTGRELQGPKWAAKRPALADHLWVVVTAGAKRERIPIGPPTPENREAAERKAAQLRQLLERSDSVESKLTAPTLREVVDTFLTVSVKRLGLAPTTVRQRRQQLNQLCQHLGATRVDRITADQLTAWWSTYVEDGDRSHRTDHGHLDALAKVLEDAEFNGVNVDASLDALRQARRRISRRNPRTKQARRKRDTSLDVAPLTPGQVVAMNQKLELEGWPDSDLRLFVVLGMDCGLRLGELLALRWEDFDGIHLRIHRSRDATGEDGLTKTGKERRVEVSRRARQLLRERRLECGLRGRPNSRVFRHATRAVYRKKLAALAEAAGIRATVTPTTLRHTYGSTLVMNGVPLSYVASQLGHSSIAVTERYYARWIPTEDYSPPPALAHGEVPADLLCRLATTSPTVATIGGKSE